MFLWFNRFSGFHRWFVLFSYDFLDFAEGLLMFRNVSLGFLTFSVRVFLGLKHKLCSCASALKPQGAPLEVVVDVCFHVNR